MNGWAQEDLFPDPKLPAARVRISDAQDSVDPFNADSVDKNPSLQTFSTDQEASLDLPPPMTQTSVATMQPLPALSVLQSGGAEQFAGPFSNNSNYNVGLNLYAAPEFKGGLIVLGDNVAMKIGGYVKADFIHDFNPINSTDSFVTTSIPVGAPPRTKTRFHAKQSRLSFDTRWLSDGNVVKVYIEGDFFDDGNGGNNDNHFRLRQAYGEVGPLIVGQTWTTFTDVAAAPATLDFEGSVSAVNRRQAQARWTQKIFRDDLSLALAVEDTKFIIEPPFGVTGTARSPSPDFVGHLRLERERGSFQVASLYRIGGFQPTGKAVITKSGWGNNFTGVYYLSDSTKAYSQIVFGEGIGSYRGLPDSAPNSTDGNRVLPMFGWMVGLTHNWNDLLSSNFTYAENSLDTTPFQNPDDVKKTTYLAANLIYSPLKRVKVGVEYLYGIRENVSGASGAAHRIQASFIFDLP
ncbi:DcaP family trimeric outer membrane transporter [uncultured Gimesia sp.]|uniref:DcaP family trimeric outer membrane transporter n=1 Tax=uncultured Gimesia sp. TaxID=1678688 RepID=UPI00261BE968|nr:DcaP family trimeric outer membrane transporter [uncultured Gimesia sp.]